MKTIVAIGAGELKSLETFKIDKEIVSRTGKKNPVALFIPPKSRDIDYYWEIFQDVYGKKIGCKPHFLDLVRRTPTTEEMKNKVLSSDLIYIGGGNTLHFMRRIRKLGMDALLKLAYERGITLSGISAGAICWFRYGMSNSNKFYHPEDWDYVRIKGMGFLPFTICPHYNDEKREEDLTLLINKYGGIGIALESGCAFEAVEDQYRIITSQVGSQAYKIFKNKGRVVVKPIKQEKEFKPINFLL